MAKKDEVVEDDIVPSVDFQLHDDGVLVCKDIDAYSVQREFGEPRVYIHVGGQGFRVKETEGQVRAILGLAPRPENVQSPDPAKETDK